MRLTMLGGLNLNPADFHRPKPLLLLAYLAVEGSKEKRHLYELFWPGAADQATSLRMALSQLRKVSPDLTTSDERTVATGVENDLALLQTAINEKNAEALEALYRGEFLQGFSLPDWGAELEEWVYSTREFVAGRVRAAYVRVAEGEAGKGEFQEAARWAERAYGLGKDHLEPEELERLYPLLVAGDSALSSEVKKQAKEFGVELSLSYEEARARYFKETTADTPQTQSIPHNLPRSKTSFIGRDPELVELGERIGQREVLLITLLGPGGIGKTRLALQLAHGQLQEESFPGGIYFVPLEALSEPSQIPLALGQTLKLKVTDDPLGAVKAGIGEKRILLILDNFEHLVDGALLVSELLEACPGLKVVVTSRERLSLEEEHVLPLQGLPFPKEVRFAEAEYVDAIRLFVQRAKRARLDFELTPENLSSVLEICRLVEGSPLGIELAAVWLRSLSVTEIAHELKQNLGVLETSSRNIPGRHQSIQAAFEHSWKLLKPKEQLTLARLSVFKGGFTREAASAVVDSNLALLAALVDKSLLRVSEGEGRYDFHPLVYQYATEKLAELPEEKAQTRAKHAQHFLSAMEATVGQFSAQINLGKNEYDNLLAALHWSQETGDGLFGLRLSILLVPFWQSEGYLPEGMQWFKTLLSHPAAQEPTEARAKALIQASNFANILVDNPQARAYAEEALAIAKVLGQDVLTIRALAFVGTQAQGEGDHERAKQYLGMALEHARAIGHEAFVGNLLRLLSDSFGELGEIEKALELLEECTAIARKQGAPVPIAIALCMTGYWKWMLAELVAAKNHLEEALRIAQEISGMEMVCKVQSVLSGVLLDLGDVVSAEKLGKAALEFRWKAQDRFEMIRLFEHFANLGAVQKDSKRAATLWGIAERLRQEMNAPTIPQWKARHQRYMVISKSQLDEANFKAAWQEGRLMGLGQAVQYALGVSALIPS